MLFFTKEKNLKRKFDKEILKYIKYAGKNRALENIVKDERQRMCIKENCENDFIKFIHEISEHCVRVIMYLNIKNIYKVKNIKWHIRDVCNKCEMCLLNKEINKKVHTNVSIKSRKPFEIISTDIFGPFELEGFGGEYVSNKGYLLTITDVYSRYTKVYFNEKIRSQEIISCLENWILNLGRPRKVISDNGPQYISRTLKRFTNQQGIIHQLIPAYHPQSNGISERINKTVAEILRMNKGFKLTKIIEKIEHRINNNCNTSLGVSKRNSIWEQLL